MKTYAFAAVILGFIAFPGSARAGTLRQMLESGQNVECTFDRTDEGHSTRGTVHMADKKMRGDFVVSTKGQPPMTLHTLHSGDWLYSWGGPMGETQGTKMNVSKISKKKSSSPQSAVDLDQKMDMDCKPWTATASRFAVPAGVTFQDHTPMLQQGMGAAAGGGNACAACDQAPADARDQCRQALGCK